MADLKQLYISLAREIAEEYNISGILQSHNSSLSEESPAYTDPLDNTISFGNIKEVTNSNKSGYGTMVTVQNKKERDNVLGKIWNELDGEKIREKYILKLLENNILADVGELTFTRNTKFSEGSKTIFLNIVEMKKDGSPKSNPITAFVIFAKGLKGTSVDPHELMTASLISMNRIVNFKQINNMGIRDRNQALDDLSKEIFDNSRNVIGYSTKDASAIEGDRVNLAKAISVSNYIVGLCKRNGAVVEKVYQTGAAWHSDLTRRNRNYKGRDPLKDELIKDYNSSDLIVKINHHGVIHHWGISLKKKSGMNDDPTLLNKPLVGEASASGKQKAGYLYLRATPSQKNEMRIAEENFWKQVYMVKFGPPPVFAQGKKLGDDVAPSNWSAGRDWKKQLNDVLSDLEKNAALTGKEIQGRKYPTNFFFRKLDEVFRDIMSKPENFREFLDLAFRFDIEDYVNQEHFHFSLITGTGTFKPDGTLVVNPAEEKSSALMKEVFTTLLSGGLRSFSNPTSATQPPNLILEKWSGKSQAFENTAAAAKLYYTMKIDTLPIINLEVRYKGAITASPQFQVFITVDFKRFLHQIKRNLDKKGIHAFLKR
jgi:hypothetical protein